MSYNFVNTAFFDSIYGDGSRGDATITGTTTMNEDRFYNNLTISSTGILIPNNYRIFVKEKLEIQAGGAIRHNGRNAAGTLPGGNIQINGTLRSFGRIGANPRFADVTLNLTGSGSQTGGGANLNVVAQPNVPGNNTLFGAGSTATFTGWNGGNGGSATLSGGTGYAGTLLAIEGTSRSLIYLLKTGYFGGGAGIFLTTELGCGPGGASGAVDAGTPATDYGGPGGGGGGGILIFAKEILNNGTIEAKGGNGAAGAHATAKAGGGGGGAGGVIITVCRFPTNLGTLDVSGGTGGAGVNGGSAGGQGNTGLVMSFNC
jgi:hypothetical protein